jgi:hypothetical protein
MRFLFLLAAAAAAACSDNPTVALDHSFTLGVGETVEVSGTDLSIKFDYATEDSRCPTQVQCIWAGNAQIQLIARSQGQTTPVRLNTFEGAKEAIVGDFRIRLIELVPVPVEIKPIPAGSYRASLVVSESGGVCTEEARPALMVAIADSVTGATSGFTNVIVAARDGAFADSVAQATYPASPFNGPIALAYERRGTFTVTVRADGYVPWSRAGVVVSGDRCHVATVSLTARMAR